jgi:hypothetical protein
MAETFEKDGNLITLIDLSDRLENETSDFEPMPHRIDYVTIGSRSIAHGSCSGWTTSSGRKGWPGPQRR